jgi:GDP-D-mannose 3', 5'-epimerase
LVDVVADIAGKRMTKRHNLQGPQGVRGRNSDNSRLRKELHWEPSISLCKGLARTYPWIEQEIRKTSSVGEERAVGSAAA